MRWKDFIACGVCPKRSRFSPSPASASSCSGSRTSGSSNALRGAADPPRAHVQLNGVGIEAEPLAEHRQSLVVVPLVVELVRALVVLLGTQERRGHRATDLRLKGDSGHNL